PRNRTSRAASFCDIITYLWHSSYESFFVRPFHRHHFIHTKLSSNDVRPWYIFTDIYFFDSIYRGNYKHNRQKTVENGPKRYRGHRRIRFIRRRRRHRCRCCSYTRHIWHLENEKIGQARSGCITLKYYHLTLIIFLYKYFVIGKVLSEIC